MKDAMMKAPLGDDIFRDCPTTIKFERMIADLLGKEAALMVTSGTQANLISQMIVKKDVGDAIILGHKSHMLCYERGGICSIAGLMPRVL